MAHHTIHIDGTRFRRAKAGRITDDGKGTVWYAGEAVREKVERGEFIVSGIDEQGAKIIDVVSADRKTFPPKTVWKRTDFVCWLRNPSRAAWALCLPYDIGGEKKSFYPDFLIVRSDPSVDYVVDILEPHGNQYVDNLPKAKALAEYAKAEDRLGRIQLIHKTTDAGGTSRFIRLDLTDMAVRDKVLRAFSNDELDHIFETDGIIE